jgi:Flp pilus assembly protein TadB
MAGLSRSTCPHGRTPSTCLICQALDAGELSDARRRAAPEQRAGGSLNWTVAKFGIVAVLALVVVSWAAAFFWAALRILELLAVAVVVGWVCWRLGVRHGRRNPG